MASSNYYDNRKRAILMLRQLCASGKPVSVEDMHKAVALEYGFGRKFVLEFLELHEEALTEVGDGYVWRA